MGGLKWVKKRVGSRYMMLLLLLLGPVIIADVANENGQDMVCFVVVIEMVRVGEDR